MDHKQDEIKLPLWNRNYQRKSVQLRGIDPDEAKEEEQESIFWRSHHFGVWWGIRPTSHSEILSEVRVPSRGTIFQWWKENTRKLSEFLTLCFLNCHNCNIKCFFYISEHNYYIVGLWIINFSKIFTQILLASLCW